ncbi:hypothetical protein LJB86_01640 [Deltaproteobacteria bacterium OttesenSCG-928-M10]|nr:hypothetical protein [Deltaproteobacteria bacterium OttesenSCG-928-M10]MDL2259440.1 hypothetical protein [Deltaproteobacteria bacterium OttesenSCG-928-K17]
MTNLADLSADSKLSEEPLKSSLRHLTSALSGVVITIGEIMKSPRVNDEEYDQMSMIIMALQKSIAHIEFDWPDFDEETEEEPV